MKLRQVKKWDQGRPTRKQSIAWYSNARASSLFVGLYLYSFQTSHSFSSVCFQQNITCPLKCLFSSKQLPETSCDTTELLKKPEISISGATVTASHLIWELETEPWSFRRTACVLNPWAVSPARCVFWDRGLAGLEVSLLSRMTLNSLPCLSLQIFDFFFSQASGCLSFPIYHYLSYPLGKIYYKTPSNFKHMYPSTSISFYTILSLLFIRIWIRGM